MSATTNENHKFEPSSEDTIQCFFFSSAFVDQESLEQLCEKINTKVKTLVEEYLWHRDEFKVIVPLDKNSADFPVHLVSSTCFGDNIEDEWYIVHIILELTKQFTDLIVQIKDSDGDFLLIEAADCLPKWANPESTENRVFIYKNRIHMIPPNLASVDEHLKLSDALLCIVGNHDQTLAAPEIQNAILNRIGNYPDKHKKNTHNAVVMLPLEIAALLKLQPKLIAPIVDAYCNHDVIDIRTCKTLDYQNSISVTVKFTKFLYAMLLHSKSIKHLMNSSEKNKNITLGKKITCGFKMIMNRSSDIYCSKEYHKFLKSLTDNGYFKCNIEGSQEYQKLLEQAKNYFYSVECPVISNVSRKITEITASDEYLKAIDVLQSSTPYLLEDDEDWLKIHPDQLNELLNSRYGKKTTFENKDIITPQNISTHLTDFLKKTSDYEGIESVEKEPLNDEIDFDSEQFVNSIEKMLKILSTGTEKQEVDSDFSDEDLSGSDVYELEQELQAKLQGRDENLKDNKTILQNFISSMREEQASSGPSSNLITSLGCRKTDFLDSDDD